MPFAVCGDINIFYDIKGPGNDPGKDNGPRLFYISGTGGDLRRPQNALTSSFPDHFETLSFDQRGLAQADKPDAPYSMTQYADDAANLLDVVGWEDCYVMGISFGGMVTQELALRHPGRVTKLVLGCTSSGGAGGSSYPLHELQDMPLEEKIKFRMSKNDKRLNEKWQQENLEKFKVLFDKAVETGKFAADDPGKAMGSRRQLEARAKHDTYERLPEINIPVLVCGGRYDGQAEPEVVKNLAGASRAPRSSFLKAGIFSSNKTRPLL